MAQAVRRSLKCQFSIAYTARNQSIIMPKPTPEPCPQSHCQDLTSHLLVSLPLYHQLKASSYLELISIVHLHYCRKLTASTRTILNVDIPQEHQQTVPTHQKGSWCVVLGWACLSPDFPPHCTSPWSCRGSETSEMEFFPLTLGFCESTEEHSESQTLGSCPPQLLCSWMPPYPSVRYKISQVHGNCGGTPHFLLEFWDKISAPQFRQKAFLLAFA